MPLAEQQLLAYTDAGNDIIVGAVQLKRPRSMRVGTGATRKIRRGAVGDWVVREADGDKYFMSPEAFANIFTRAAGSDSLAYILNGYAALNLT